MTESPFGPPHEHGFKAQALGLSTRPLLLLRDLILKQTGLTFDDGKLNLLADRLADLVTVTGSPSMLDYYYLLKYDESTDAHWHQLLDRLAVPETYFWRQPDQFQALVQEVLPQHARARPQAGLRIWCAACCTGEEPLSIAMALDRDGWFERVRIEIFATDGSPALVERARKGVYGERSMRVIPEDLRKRYFTNIDSRWRVDPALLARVQWGRVNLMAAHEVRGMALADVIYCRNVLIYFSDDAIRQFAATLASSMPETGILFLGAAESLLRLSTDFEMIELGPAFAYTPMTAAVPPHITTDISTRAGAVWPQRAGRQE